jgi:hypothetical protein
VIETEDGEEITVEKPVVAPKPDGKSTARPVARRGGREIPKPSMARVAKRTAIFGPLILAVVFWTGGDSTTASKVFTAVTLIAFFIPFSYLVDSIMYRVYSKRQRDAGSG